MYRTPLAQNSRVINKEVLVLPDDLTPSRENDLKQGSFSITYWMT